MNILALDTSTQNFSIAVAKDDHVLVSRNAVLKGVLSDSIMPKIKSALAKAGISLTDIDGFAVGIGPGSFTSLRVGLSTVKAFAFATGKPVVGIGSLDVLAEGVDGTENDICTICDARRDMVYSATFTKKKHEIKRVSDYALSPVDDVLKNISRPTIFVGDGVKLYKDQISDKMKKYAMNGNIFADERLWLPQAKCLALLAHKRFKSKKADNADRLVPLYLYPHDCQVVKKK